MKKKGVFTIFYLLCHYSLSFTLGVVVLMFLNCADTTNSTDNPNLDTTQNSVEHDYIIAKDIGPEGGEIEIDDPDNPAYGAGVEIPQNALSETTTLSINPLPNPDNLPEDVEVAGEVIDFLPDGTMFENGATLTLPYRDKDNDGFIDNTNIPENNISVMTLNEQTLQWKDIPVKQLDTENNLVHFESDHFSQYTAVSYLTKQCETDESGEPDAEISCGPYYFTLYYNFRYPPYQYKASVSNVVDLNAGNATLINNNYAVLKYDGFKNLFDKVLDARQWTWEWEIREGLTDLTQKVNLNDDEIITEITAESSTQIKFTWNFNYQDMAPAEMMVLKFRGTTNSLCVMLDKTPKAPENLEIIETTDTDVYLLWDEVINIYGSVQYNIYVSDDGNGNTEVYSSSENSITISGLTPKSNYEFKVATAYENDVESKNSSAVYTTTSDPNPPPSIPET